MRYRFSPVLCLVLAIALLTTSAVNGQQPKILPFAKDIKNIESCVMAPDTVTIFATAIGEFGTKGDGTLVQIQNGKQTTLLDGFDDPKGIVWSGDSLYITDIDKVWRVRFRMAKFDIPPFVRNMTRLVEDIGRTLVAGPDQFPIKPLFLNDIEADAAGNLYVSDSGDLQGGKGAVFRISAQGKIETIATPEKYPSIKTPNGLLMDGPEHLLVLDFAAGDLNRLGLKDGSWEKLAGGFDGGDGIVRDWDGDLYLSSWKTGKVSVMRSKTKTPGQFGKYEAPELLSEGKFEQAADLGIDARQGHILIPDMKAGTISTMSIVDNNPRGIDASEIKLNLEPLFDEEFEIDRPVLVTHAGDKSGRLFVGTQPGKVYVLKPGSKDEPKLFFDLTKKTTFKMQEFEKGLLGIAFSPSFAKNREFYAYYSPTNRPQVAVISRFKVSEKDPNFADAADEEEVMVIEQPFWNHNGGTLVFGPDGKLYVGLGDGGSANDPFDNGQDLSTPLGGVLRIDVDGRDPGKPYAIPKDNPLANRAGACGEKWAWGLRNLWRISFDRETGLLWGADVGQDIWEEINILERGGNYGWRRRESMHPFTANGLGPKPEFIEPIWEYHHDEGKSITGGHVYRGKAIKDLQGHYVYGDFVSGKMWGLKYDPAKKKVTANRPIPGGVLPVMSFGEDENGELYVVTDGGKKVSKLVP